MKHLTELAEDQAHGKVAELYADIRRVLGTSFVNLVYRHLATEPAALAWAWQAIRPHLLSGELATQAQHLGETVRRQIAPWTLPAVPRAEPHQDIDRLLQMYNHANALNLLALTHLLGGEHGLATKAMADSPPTASQAPVGLMPKPGSAPEVAPASTPLPGVPPMDTLTDEQRAQIATLKRHAEATEPTIIASLYRHLAAWPDGLPFAMAVQGPLQQQGLLAQARQATFAAAQSLAQDQPLAMPATPPAFIAHFGATLGHLSETTISKMIPIGHVLRAALDQGVCIDS